MKANISFINNIFYKVNFSRVFYKSFFIAVNLFIFYYAIHQYHYDFKIADWLINYQGGFVRRGLIGEILLIISKLSNISLDNLVIILQILLYTVFLFNTYQLASRIKLKPIILLFIASPAFVLFPVLDLYAGFRKELLLFTILSVLCNKIDKLNECFGNSFSFLLGLTSIFLILSHEMLLVFIPYLISVVILYDQGLSKRVFFSILSLVPSFLLFGYIALHAQTDYQTVFRICNSLGEAAPPNCYLPSLQKGTISFLVSDFSSSRRYVKNLMTSNTVITYMLVGFLSFLPLLINIKSTQFYSGKLDIRTRKWLLLCISTSFIACLPLLMIAADYGRFIHIHVVCLTLIILMVSRDAVDKKNTSNSTCKKILQWCFSILYIVSWRLIHFNSSFQQAFPFLKFFK
ncbi:MAG: hypothetical protein JXB49_31535 [Bacteroidales bacterium]|nr:hypothetical protein [Bacteroidales bacterium]